MSFSCKDSYFKQAAINLQHAETRYKEKFVQQGLFDDMPEM